MPTLRALLSRLSLGQWLVLLFALVSLVPLALQALQLRQARAERAAALAREDLERAAGSLAAALAGDGFGASAGSPAEPPTERLAAQATAAESLAGTLTGFAARLAQSDVRITLLSKEGRALWKAGDIALGDGAIRVERPIAGTGRTLRLERPDHGGLSLRGALWPAVATSLALLAAGWLFVGRLMTILSRPFSSVSAAMRRAAQGDFDARTQGNDGPPELERLGLAFNDFAATMRSRLEPEQRAEKNSRELVTSSQRLFESAIHAKEPWTRHHPTLLKAYVKAMGRHLASSRESERDDWVEVLQPAEQPEPLPPPDKRRRDPRHVVSELWAEAPVKSKVADLSSSGLRLEGLEGLPVGKPVVLTIRDRSRSHQVHGRVTWCRLSRFLESRGEKLPIYATGILFAPESEDAVNRLLAGRLSRQHVA